MPRIAELRRRGLDALLVFAQESHYYLTGYDTAGYVFFQVGVLQQPVDNLWDIALGFIFVLLGLATFIRGLEMGLFPIGEAMAHAFARKGNLIWLLVFGFLLGFSTTIAEPALIAIAGVNASMIMFGLLQEKYEDPEEMAAFMKMIADWNGGTFVDIRKPYMDLRKDD